MRAGKETHSTEREEEQGRDSGAGSVLVCVETERSKMCQDERQWKGESVCAVRRESGSSIEREERRRRKEEQQRHDEKINPALLFLCVSSLPLRARALDRQRAAARTETKAEREQREEEGKERSDRGNKSLRTEVTHLTENRKTSPHMNQVATATPSYLIQFHYILA